MHLDYNHGLNKSINKLRFVLGDDPESPTFIETLPRVGYRFIGIVQIVGGELAAPVAAGLPQAESLVDPAHAFSPADSYAAHENATIVDVESKRAGIQRRPWMWAGVAAGILVVLGVWLWRIEAARRHVTTIRSLAVLPLRDLSPVQGQEYFADGITEELITSLAQSLPLRVISRTSVMRYKQTSEPIKQIARELGVEAIVEGAVTRDGNRIKVTLQLIDATEDRHLWAHSYERDFGDFLGMEDELSREMSTQIGHNLSVQPQSKAKKVHSVDAKAHELYLQGRYFWNKRTGEGIKKAAEYFQQAIDQDSNYAQAYVGLADCYQFSEPPTLPPLALADKAKQMAMRALELDDSLGEAHATLGLIAENFEHDWGGAEREYRRALELSPNYATAHQWYGEYFSLLGRFDESLAEMKIARDLDPLSLVIIKDSGEVYYHARKYDQAIEFYRKALDMDSHFNLARRYLASAYLQKQEFSSAIAELETVTKEEKNHDTLSELAFAYALSGRREEAEKILRDMKGMSARPSSQACNYAIVYTGLGNKDKAFEWLERAYREGAGALTGLKADPRWDSLRGDPRFADLLKRIGADAGP